MYLNTGNSFKEIFFVLIVFMLTTGCERCGEYCQLVSNAVLHFNVQERTKHSKGQGKINIKGQAKINIKGQAEII